MAAVVRYESRKSRRLSQGDIYRDVAIVEGCDPQDVSRTSFPYAVILSQECDLEQDWKAYTEQPGEPNGADYQQYSQEDKLLRHIMLAPCYVADAFREGVHIANRQMRTIPDGEWKKNISENKHIRYHCLPECEGFLQQDLVVDFKHYFTIERDAFYAKARKDFTYVCSVAVLYRDAMARRFAEYLSRIGFPERDQVVKGTKSLP